jgi:hypothetical protein
MNSDNISTTTSISGDESNTLNTTPGNNTAVLANKRRGRVPQTLNLKEIAWDLAVSPQKARVLLTKYSVPFEQAQPLKVRVSEVTKLQASIKRDARSAARAAKKKAANKQANKQATKQTATV